MLDILLVFVKYLFIILIYVWCDFVDVCIKILKINRLFGFFWRFYIYLVNSVCCSNWCFCSFYEVFWELSIVLVDFFRFFDLIF